MGQYSLIGKRLPRVDARDKVTGKALYTDDLSLPRMLCGAILRSPLPHAAIVSIDTSKAVKLPGVWTGCVSLAKKWRPSPLLIWTWPWRPWA